MSKRILSLLMALALCFSMLPMTAFTEGGEGNTVSGGLMDESGEGGGVLVPPGGTTEGGGIYIPGENTASEGAGAASVTKSDGTERGAFSSLTDALDAAEDGDTVTLLADHETNWDAVDAGEELMAVVKKRLTLDLNGFTVDYLVVGEVIPDEEGGILESTEGDLTVVENSLAVGCISSLQLEKGKLTIEGGEIGKLADTGSFICSDENGEVNIKGGKVWFFGCEGGTANITGGKVYQLSVRDEAIVNISGGTNHGGWGDGSSYDTSTWSVGGGTLNITGGTFGSIHFNFTGGTVSISGGIFQSISNNDVSKRVPVMPLLADGYAFYGKDADDTYTVVQDSRKTALENVKVLAHTDHIFMDGTCIACGALACEKGCIAHATIEHFTWHFKTMQELADQISGTGWIYLSYPSVTVKFLTDVTVTEPVTIGQCSTHINLDLDGHTISGELDTDPMIEANFGYGGGFVNGVYVLQCIAFQNGTIENTGSGAAIRLSGGATTLENVDVKGDLALTCNFAGRDNYTPTFLGGGSFTKICPAANDEKGTWSRYLKEMLSTGCCFIDSAGNRVNADQWFGSNDNTTIKVLENVRVKACDHKDDNGKYTLFEDATTSYGAPAKRCTVCGNLCLHDEITTDGSNTCTACGLSITVSATNLANGIDYGPYYYTGLDDAVSDFRTVHGGRRPTVKLLASTNSTYGYEWWKDSDDGITIDLAGHDLTLHNNKATGWVKIRNTSNTHAKVYGTVNVDRSFGTATLTVPETDNDLTIDEVKIGTNGSASLAGGSFGKISVKGEKTPASLPAAGYYFANTETGKPAALYDADGNALTELTNVTVMKCSHDGSELVYDIAESVWKCPCGQKAFVASVTKDDITTLYTDLQDAFNAADGGTVKLMKNMDGDVTVNTDKPFILDLNGYDIFALTVNSKITIKDSAETKGRIIENLVVSSGMSIGELLEEGYAFRYVSTGVWCIGTWQTVGNVSVQQAPIKSVTAVNPTVTAEYGKTSEVTLIATVVPTAEGGTYSCQWYRDGGTRPPITGATGITYQLPDDLSAGTHTYILAAEKDGYEKSCNFTVTVRPVSIAGATVEGTNPTYNGTAQSPTVTVKLGEKVLVENKDYTLSGTGSATDAGSYELTVVGKGSYTDKIENVKWRIEPKTVTNPTVNVAPCVYNGFKQEPRVELKDGEKVIPEGEYTVAYSNNTDAGNGTVTIKDVAGGNYVVSGSTTFPIEQDRIDESRIRVEVQVFNELAKTYEADLQTILDHILLEQYKDGGYGTVTYYHDAYGEVAFADYYDIGTAKIENGMLILPIKNASGVQSGYDIGTLTIRVDSTNYKSFDLVIHIVARNKIVPMLDGTVNASDITYGQTLNDSEFTVTGSMEAPGIDAPGTIQEIKGTFAWTDGAIKPDAGGYEAEWIFTPDAPEYAAATGKVTVKVDPRPVKISGITAADKVYDGLTAAATDCSKAVFDGKMEGDDLTVTAIGAFRTADANREDALVVDLSLALGGEDKDNYVIDDADSQRETRAKITPAMLTLTPDANQSKTFGAAEPTLTYTVSGAVNHETPALTGAPARETGENVGTYAITLGSLAVGSDGSFKANNYDLKLSDAVVHFTITKAAAPVIEDVTVSHKYTVTAGTAQLSGRMPSDAGTLTYTPGSASKTGSVTVSDWSANVDTGTVSYNLSDGKPGDTVTLPVTVSSTNYEDTVVNVVITLTERDDQAALYITGDTAVVYGQTVQLSAEGGSGTGTVTYTVINGTGEATIDQSTGVLTPVKVGTVKVTATKAGDGDHNEIASAPFEVTITPAASTGEPKYTKITTGGKTLNDAALTIDGSTLSPNAGTLEWVDDEGNVLPNDTVVTANRAYQWRFTPDDTNYTVLTGEVTLYRVASSGGGGGGTTRYTVSFETNGGSKISKQTAARNTTLKEPTAPTKEGFDFAGWYTDKDLKEKYDFSAKVTKSLTLYAAWTEKDQSENQIILTIGEKAAQVFGTTKTNDVAPKIVNDRTMLPARFVAENLGAKVEWDGEKELVTVNGKKLKTGEDITILIYIGSDVAYVNGKEIKLDSAAFVENDRTYTPIRFISEELGASVTWIETEQKAVITK